MMRWLLLVASMIASAGSAAAAPAKLAFIYAGGESTGPVEIRRAVKGLADEAELTIFAPGDGGEGLGAGTDLTRFDLVFVDGAADGLARYVAQLDAARARTTLVVVNPTPMIRGNVPLDEHPWLDTYWANQSQDNYARLVRYLVTRVLRRPSPNDVILPPITYPEQGFYHPEAPALFDTLETYLAWYRARPSSAHVYDPEKLTLGIYFHIIAYQQKNNAQIDALVRAIERRGQNAIVIAGRGRPELGQAFVRDDRPVIDALLFSGERLNINDNAAGRVEAGRLGVPILDAINYSGLTRDEFAASPSGLHPQLTPFVVGAEQDGLIEPIVVSGKSAVRDGRTFAEPFPAQVEWRVNRALAWAKLHRASNGSKRVVFTYWSEGGGKAAIGGDPDDFLDVQASLVRLLGELRDHGYDVGSGPLPDRDTLSRRMALDASNVGNWAPAELERRVARGDVALVPEETYRAWFDELPEARRMEIISMWGPPPGNVMVHTDKAGKRFLVIPRIEFGNVLVAPHPDWGILQNTKALTTSGAVPPHHQYVAFFLWLQHTWRADAWVSLFSNIVLQGGKSEGPAADDHIALLLGALPNIHPERLGSNGGPANKRKGMAQTVSWFNLEGPSDAAEQLFELRARRARYAAQPDPRLREEAEPLIRAEVVRTGLDRALGIDVPTAPFPELLVTLDAYLEELAHTQVPRGSKVLGEGPAGPTLVDMVTGMLGSEFRTAITPLTKTPFDDARALVASVLEEGRSPAEALAGRFGRSVPEAETHLALARDYALRLSAAPRELGGILDALEGRWIEPGPMDDPLRRPDAVPPGRSLYAYDQAAVPTAEAEAIGVRLADALIAAHRNEHGGAYPSKLAFVLFSGEIAKDNGVTEAQILHLLGTRAVRNARGEVTGVELIPREALGRPRVDVLVTTSGTYRDHYQDKVELIAQATRLAAASPEGDNPVAAATRAAEASLKAAGETAERAAALAGARVFSPAPGAYSPNIQFLAKSGDQRGDETRMADLFTSRMSHAYGAGLYGVPARSAYEQNLAHTDSATLPRSEGVNGLLDNPMPAGFLGGLNLAAKAAGSGGLDLYVSNVRDAQTSSIEPAARALQKELRTRYLNRTWLTDMKAHGYDGARNMMFLTDHLDLWDTTASQMVTSADWADVKSVYVDDTLGLDLDAFFDRSNPHAQQVLLADLLGAASRGQWQASAADLAQVAGRLARSAIDHGAACEAGDCRNPALQSLVSRSLMNVPGGARLAAKYRAAIADAATGAAPSGYAPAPGVRSAVPSAAPSLSAAAAPPLITGRVLDEAVNHGEASRTAPAPALWLVAAVAMALLAFGWARGLPT